MDRMQEITQRLVHGYVLLDRNSGNNLGRANAKCQVNLSSLNLVVTLSLPSAGPAEPPTDLHYNSYSQQQTQLGIGWSNLYTTGIWVGTTQRFLYSIQAPSGVKWIVQRYNPYLPVATAVLDPMTGLQTKFGYTPDDPTGFLSSITDSGGRTTQFVVSNFLGYWCLTWIGFPDQSSVTLGYTLNVYPQLTSWTNYASPTAPPEITSFQYDACQRLAFIKTANSELTRFTYPDLYTRVMTDNAGNVTTFTLDGNMNISRVVQQPLSGPTVTTLYQFDSVQRLTSYIDGNGNTTQFTYVQTRDLSYRLQSIIEPTGIITFAWNPAPGTSLLLPAQLQSITDENGNISTLTWAIIYLTNSAFERPEVPPCPFCSKSGLVFRHERKDDAEHRSPACRPTPGQADNVNDSHILRKVKQILRTTKQTTDSNNEEQGQDGQDGETRL